MSLKGECEALIHKLRECLIRIVFWLEALVALALIITVVVSGFDVMRLIKEMFMTPASQSYLLLQGTLSHILLLIIGSELAIMLLKHTPGAVIEVMVYATARKLLMPSQISELLLGVLAIAGLFAIRRFLFVQNIEESSSHILSAATAIPEANLIAGTNMPITFANSLGGALSILAGNKTIAQGERFNLADAQIEPTQIIDGVVATVKISKAPPEGVLWR